jgi:hypothetical protein
MIASHFSHPWHDQRVGGMQPLSAILPVVLERYGLQLPAETESSDVAVACLDDDRSPAPCGSATDDMTPMRCMAGLSR